MVSPSTAAPLLSKGASLVILYGIGGLSDVGRHAILAAMEKPEVSKITVLTEFPELLDLPNWECNCPKPHTNPSSKGGDDHDNRVNLVKIQNRQEDLSSHFQGATAVISCLGHRQPGWSNPDLKKRGIIAAEGNQQVIDAMTKAGIDRAVVMSSMGIQEDWPPVEFHWAGKIMKLLFKTNTRKAFKDLTEMEVLYKKSSIDYVFIRPTGLGEEVVPVGKWMLQKEKYKDAVGMNMAKMDCARYMVQEALEPTRHKSAVVIGSYEEELANGGGETSK
mmetsp:Transcript_80598/g.121111  ORF Transcript_80598/g.121111 Transcript_80598/m.121111 type:complete len:276 (-) Transcript_80598:85-912(-)